MLFEASDKKCPICKGDTCTVNLDEKTKYICIECQTVVYVPLHEDKNGTKQLLKG